MSRAPYAVDASLCRYAVTFNLPGDRKYTTIIDEVTESKATLTAMKDLFKKISINSVERLI